MDSTTIEEMFKSRSNIDNIPTEKILTESVKLFQWGKVKVGVCQVELVNPLSLIEREDFDQCLVLLGNKLQADYIVFSGVNILERNTYVYCPSKKLLDILNKAMKFNSHKKLFRVNRILLRKTDFIPALKEYFESE